MGLFIRTEFSNLQTLNKITKDQIQLIRDEHKFESNPPPCLCPPVYCHLTLGSWLKTEVAG